MTTDELKALLAKATRGPWKWRLKDGPEWFLSPGILKVEGGMTDGTPMGDMTDRANARLIALAPQLAEALIEARVALAPFSEMAGEMFAANWNDDRVAISFVTKSGPLRLTFKQFREARAAIASIDAIMEGREDD